MEDGWRPPKEIIFHENCLGCGTKIICEATQFDPLAQLGHCPNTKCEYYGIDIDPTEYIYDDESLLI